MGSNREFKLKKYAENPFCYYCGCKMVLTNIPEIKGKPDPRMCTVEHLVSRYHPERWVKKGEQEPRRRVLACFECNQKRQIDETNRLPAHIRVAVGRGYSLNPRGKALFHQTVETVEEVYQKLRENGIEVFRFDETQKALEERPNSEVNINPLADKLAEISTH